MPSIGDITGRITIQDTGSPVAVNFGKNIDAVSKTVVASMARATLATETAAREISAKLAKIKTSMKPTDSAKGLVADLESLNIKLREEVAAVKAGPAAIDTLNKKRLEQANALRVAAAQAQAGVSAESALGKSIASQFAVHDRLQRELQETAAERAKSIALAEREAERYNRLTQMVTGLAIAFVALAGRAVFQFLKQSAQEAIEAERAIAQLRAGVESTGAAAGKSVEELSALADELSRLSGFDDELIAGGEAILLTFRRVRGEAFDQTMRLAIDLSARFGKDIDSSVIMIAKALDMLMAGSAKGLSALSKAGVTFTDQQKKTMEQLVRTGQAAKAQEMFFAELEAQFGGSAEAARNTLGGALQALGVAWSNLKEQVGSGGILMTGVINNLIEVIETMTDGFKLMALGATIGFKGVLNLLAQVDIFLRRIQVGVIELQARLIKLSPLTSDQDKLQADIAVSKARYGLEQVRVNLAERNRQIDADIAKQTMAILGILPKVKAGYGDIADEIERVKSKQDEWFEDLYANLNRQTQALELLRQGMPTDQIQRLVEAAERLGRANLLDPLVLKAAMIKKRIDEITNAFKLADEAKKKFAEAEDDLDTLISKQFGSLGGNDPAMQELIDNLRAAKTLTDSIKSSEQKRLETIAKANTLYEQGLITAGDLQIVLLANADQWNIELDETQIKFEEIYEKLSYIAEGIAFDLVDNWRRAWEENESITDATVDTLRDTFLNVLQDIISQWLSSWFKAMAAWLARWIATQAAAKGAQAGLGAVSGGGGSTAGSVAGAAGTAAGSGVSANTLYGWALAAFALYVVYKGFVERSRDKFASVKIEGGSYDIIASRGQKYLDGVAQAAETILASISKFLDEWDVQVKRLGTVIVTSSKAGWNVALPGSTGKLFKSMEEAVSYAQVLALKYAEFADSVSLLVRSVIASSQAVSIEELASDISFAKELETQNLEQSALDIQHAMDLAIAQWKRAEDLFLAFYNTNLPAFAEAATSILTRLSNSLWAQYNSLAGIEEDPEKAWQRQKAAYNAQRLLVLAQLKLWELEIAARIANYNAQARLLGGGPGTGRPSGGGRDGGKINSGGGGIIGLAFGMLYAASIVAGAAEVLDPALQALLDIQDLINQAIAETPPELTDADYPGKKGRGKGRDRKQAREDLRDEIAGLEAEARGPLHRAFFDLTQNIAAFRERAKEAKLPAAELARGVELLTEAFQRSIRAQAREYAGLETDISKRLREIGEFFDEARELGADKTGISDQELGDLESQALAKVGIELANMIGQFIGLVDPMIAINAKADELREGVLAYAEAAGWSAEQIAEALDQIERGVDAQRQQGINSTLDRLFNYLKQAGLFQQDAIEHEREKALLDIQLIEAQLRFYGALTAQTQAWIDGAREFIEGADFGRDQNRDSGGGGVNPDWLARQTLSVRVVNDERDMFSDLFDNIRAAIEDWREAIDDFAKSTQDLLTDEALTDLTQQEQLAFAKSQFDELVAKANSGDLEALKMLEDARREYLSELRESEGGGYGYSKGFAEVMAATAGLLSGAKSGEQSLIDKMLEGIAVPLWRLPDLLEGLDTTLYDGINAIVEAIYNAIGNVPAMARGGVVMHGPRLIRVSEYVPEAIVPLDKLSSLVPYSLPANLNSLDQSQSRRAGPLLYDFAQRNTLSRWSSIEHTNRVSASSLRSIREDLNAIRRRRD